MLSRDLGIAFSKTFQDQDERRRAEGSNYE